MSQPLHKTDESFLDASTIRPSRAAEKLAHELAAALLRGRFPEGTVLAPEAELARRMGASRTAVRGALRLLESWGLITIQPGRNGGPVCRRPRATDLRAGIAALLHSRKASLADLFTARRAIDPVIAAEAATHRTSQQMAALRAALEAARRATGSRDKFAATDAEFDRLLAESAGLAALGIFLMALSSIGDDTMRRVAPNDEARRLTVLRAREQIVEAIARSDASAAESASLAHILETETFWRRTAPQLVDTPLRPLAFLEP